MKFFMKNWGSLLTIAFSLTLGVLLLIDPSTFAMAFIKVSGALFIAWGVFDFIRYFKTEPEKAALGSSFFSGITLSVIGCFCFFKSDWFSGVFPTLAVLYGLLQILIGFRKMQRMTDAIRLKRKYWHLRAISASITVLFGMIIVFNPSMAFMSIWVFTGITLIIEGVFDILVMVIQNKKATEV